MRFFSIGLYIIAMLGGCSLKEYRLFQTKNDTTFTKVSDYEYHEEMIFENKIQPYDRLSIKVFTQSAGQKGQQLTSMLSSRTVGRYDDSESIGLLVTKQGTVRLPLIGAVKIAGLTEDQASKKLMQEYKKYLRSPYVLVEIMNQRVFVIGEVKKPGVVRVINGTMNLIEAIARSGDLTDYASRTNIKIIRGNLRNPQVRIVDLTKMDAIRLTSLYLRPNDIVYVQPRKMKGYNMAFKEIAPPFKLLSNMLQPFVNIKYLSE